MATTTRNVCCSETFGSASFCRYTSGVQGVGGGSQAQVSGRFHPAPLYTHCSQKDIARLVEVCHVVSPGERTGLPPAPHELREKWRVLLSGGLGQVAGEGTCLHMRTSAFINHT